MSKDNIFEFELNESLFFEKGQEVLEMIRISLDPVISVQAFNEYVSIRGVVELRGEYLQADTSENREDTSLDFEDYHSKRYLEQIEERENGEASFFHRFPIEISVPSYRVDDVNEIMVSIESFDYELPNENQLKLTSTIAIHGINQQVVDPRLTTYESGERELSEDVETKETDMELDRLEESNEVETFRFEIKNEKEDSELETSEHEAIIPVREETTPKHAMEPFPDGGNTTHTNTESAEKDRWKIKTQSFADFFKTSPPPQELSSEVEEQKSFHPELAEEQVAMEESMNHMEENVVESIESRPESEDFFDSLDSVESGPSVETESRDNQVEREEDVSYLADMFRSNEVEESQFTQLRICIVQQKDTLETIADRYEIPKLQLLKQNRLEDEELVEGQLLTIPLIRKKQG